jgi:CHAT domain-containing protein
VAAVERRVGGDSVATASPLSLSASDSSRIHAELPVDDFLRASEIASRRIVARLVVLSGCESALGRAAFAEGVLGISSSFLGSGARTVVATLWSVDDRTTADLMRRYYNELSRGAGAAAALRAAQLAVREKRPEPFYWAGFVVIGDGDVSVALAPRSAVATVPALLIAVTVGLTVTWLVWRRRPGRGRMTA